MTKEYNFSKLIWQHYSQSSSYDKLNYQLVRIREIMSKHKSFRDLSAKNQFDLCVTIGCIALQTASKDLRSFSMSQDKSQVFEYAIHEGFTAPNIYELSKRKLLK